MDLIRKRQTLFFSTITFILLLFLSNLAFALPRITAPVVDEAGVLSAEEIHRLSDTLRHHHETTGVQMAVLLVDTTAGELIEDYSLAVAQQWGGGAAHRDDGVLLTLAIDDRRNRLELGYGIEPYISDGAAARILEDAAPLLRQERYGDAVAQIVDEVIHRTAEVAPGQERQEFLGPGWSLLAILLALMVGMAQGFFWSSVKGLMQGVEIEEDQETFRFFHQILQRNNRNLLLILFSFSMSFTVVPGVWVWLNEPRVFEDLATLWNFALETGFISLPIVSASLLTFCVLLMMDELIPKPNQEYSRLYAITWWLLPVLVIVIALRTHLLPPLWPLPVTSSALAWTLLIWGSGALITMGAFSFFTRTSAYFFAFLAYHGALIPVFYWWSLDQPMDTIKMVGVSLGMSSVFAWFVGFGTRHDFRSTEEYQRIYASGGILSNVTVSGSGGGGSSSGGGGGYSGGGGSFGGGGASGSW